MRRSTFFMAFIYLTAVIVNAQSPFPPHSGFPFCRCHDYSATSSPVALVVTNEGGSPYTAELSFVNVAPPGQSSECYDKIQNHGIEKIEIQTTLECLGTNVVKVFVNGVHSTGAKVDRAGPNSAILRIPFKTFPLTVVSAPTTTIQIITSEGACSTKDKLFAGSNVNYAVFNWANTATSKLMCCPTATKPNEPPPPLPNAPSFPSLPPLGPAQVNSPPPPLAPLASSPPPPSPSGFPWCQCRKESYNTPYYLQMLQPQTGPNGDLQVNALVFGDRGCSPEIDACCDMDLHKLEFHINDQCRNHVYGITVGDTSYSASYQSYGANKLVFKITQLGRGLPDGKRHWYDVPVEGLHIAFFLSAGPCGSLDTFLAPGTSYSFIDKDINCCPTFTFGA